MPTYSKSDVILVRYPFSNLSAAKVRPAVVLDAPHPSQDRLVVPLTSRVQRLRPGEFILEEWAAAGLNVESAVKRGLYTVHASLVLKRVGRLSHSDGERLEQSLRAWLGL